MVRFSHPPPRCFTFTDTSMHVSFLLIHQKFNRREYVEVKPKYGNTWYKRLWFKVRHPKKAQEMRLNAIKLETFMNVIEDIASWRY